MIKNTFPEFLASHPFIATYLAGLGFVGRADRLGRAAVRRAGCPTGSAAPGSRCVLRRHGGRSPRSRSSACRTHSFAALLRLVHGDLPARRAGQRLDLPDDPVDLRRARTPGGGDDRPRPEADRVDFKRRAAAVIGIAGAIGAFGGFLIQVVFRQASLGVTAAVKAARRPAEKLAIAQAHADWSIPALWVFLGAYVLLAATTWFFYLRRALRRSRCRAWPTRRSEEARMVASPGCWSSAAASPASRSARPCASAIRRAAHPRLRRGRIFPYDRVSLGALLAAEPDVDGAAAAPRRVVRRPRRDVRPAAERGARPRCGHRRLDDGAVLRFDRAVLVHRKGPARAAAARHRAEGVHVFREPADCAAILQAAAGARRALVIGGGLLGLEAAYALAARLPDHRRPSDGPPDGAPARRAGAPALLAPAIEGLGVEVLLGHAPRC